MPYAMAAWTCSMQHCSSTKTTSSGWAPICCWRRSRCCATEACSRSTCLCCACQTHRARVLSLQKTLSKQLWNCRVYTWYDGTALLCSKCACCTRRALCAYVEFVFQELMPLRLALQRYKASNTSSTGMEHGATHVAVARALLICVVTPLGMQ